MHGAGLGLRRSLLGELLENQPETVDFYEIAPENWMRIGGRLGRQFSLMTEKTPFVCHGLSLSLGGPEPLDFDFLNELKAFLRQHRVAHYSEHLSYCGDHGHLYDLMPIPFRDEAVAYTAARIRAVQDLLGQRIAIENISYYAAPGKAMEEIDFLNAVLAEADCDLLLDVNNVYVNSINHGYDPKAFIDRIPGDRILYCHMAGHYRQSAELLIDTHGAPITDPVWDLLAYTYRRFGVRPTLLERDFNLPPLAELLAELDQIHGAQAAAAEPQRRYG